MRSRTNLYLRRLAVQAIGLLAAFAGPVVANDFQLARISMERSSSAPVTLTFNPSPQPVVGFQFDLEYDHGALQLTPFPGEALRLAGKTLISAPIDSRTTRFLVTGVNQTPILSGTVIQFLAGTASVATIQDYPLHVANLIATFSNGQAAPVNIVDGAVTVITGSPRPLSLAGVMNAASFVAGPLAPGEIATLMGESIGPALGTLPESGVSAPVLGGTSVWFDGVQAPLLYAGPSQINVVVPFEVTGTTSELIVRDGGVVAAALQVPVASTSPAIFTLSTNGVGAGAILNQNASINTAASPAVRGEVISIFATGAGPMDPPAVNGQLGTGTSQHPVFPVTVRIGGQEAEILYAGAAPGLIAGAVQVNCRVPSTAAVGSAVEIELKIGEAQSPPGVTLSIR